MQSKVALAVDLEDNLNSSIKALVANGYNNFYAKEDSISLHFVLLSSIYLGFIPFAP